MHTVKFIYGVKEPDWAVLSEWCNNCVGENYWSVSAYNIHFRYIEDKIAFKLKFGL